MIDEKKLIAEIKDYIEEYSGIDENGMHNLKLCAMMEALGLVEQQEKVGEWIPCSERMPDRSGYDLVTLKVSSISFVSIKYFNKFCFRWEDIGNGKITAWQPLPKPWRGEEK